MFPHQPQSLTSHGVHSAYAAQRFASGPVATGAAGGALDEIGAVALTISAADEDAIALGGRDEALP